MEGKYSYSNPRFTSYNNKVVDIILLFSIYIFAFSDYTSNYMYNIPLKVFLYKMYYRDTKSTQTSSGMAFRRYSKHLTSRTGRLELETDYNFIYNCCYYFLY